jgi:hypothetical protein
MGAAARPGLLIGPGEQPAANTAAARIDDDAHAIRTASLL